ncbi:MAG: hypothetical protein ACKV2T_34065 [Kofleriaceae bacterium]
MTATGFVHGALSSFAIAFIVLVAQSWPTDVAPRVEVLDEVACGPRPQHSDVAVANESTGCRDDYQPAPPRDGVWCGVRLDDRYPLLDEPYWDQYWNRGHYPVRPDSFPTLRLRIPLP